MWHEGGNVNFARMKSLNLFHYVIVCFFVIQQFEIKKKLSKVIFYEREFLIRGNVSVCLMNRKLQESMQTHFGKSECATDTQIFSHQ